MRQSLSLLTVAVACASLACSGPAAGPEDGDGVPAASTSEATTSVTPTDASAAGLPEPDEPGSGFAAEGAESALPPPTSVADPGGPRPSADELSPSLRNISLDELVLAGTFDGADWVLSAEVQRDRSCYGIAIDDRDVTAVSGSCFGSLPVSGGIHDFAGESGGWVAISGIAPRDAVVLRTEGGGGPRTEGLFSQYLDKYRWRQWVVFVADNHRPERVIAFDAEGEEIGSYRPRWEAPG